jgi:predicted HicB family RNase H-like nuclease
MKPKRVTLSLRLPATLHSALSIRATHASVSLNALIVHLLRWHETDHPLLRIPKESKP